jgi:tRNA dimethylallyltransferase
VGYAQLLAVLDGRSTDAEARADTVRATRRLARRQESWFGRDPRIVWLPSGAPDLLERALEAVSAAV